MTLLRQKEEEGGVERKLTANRPSSSLFSSSLFYLFPGHRAKRGGRKKKNSHTHRRRHTSTHARDQIPRNVKLVMSSSKCSSSL